jgi:hypothetical protein
LPKHLVIGLQTIARLAPFFYDTDPRTDEEFAADLAELPGMGDLKDRMQNLATENSKGGARFYLKAGTRIAQIRDVHPTAFEFACIIESFPDRMYPSQVLIPKTDYNDKSPKQYREVQVAGEVVAMGIIFTGRRQVGLGFKRERAADFRYYEEKAETGALARAAGHLGYGTEDVFRDDDGNEGSLADTPVQDPLALLRARFQKPETETNSPPPKKEESKTPVSAPKPAPRERADAPIQPSAKVTTRADVMPKPASVAAPAPVQTKAEGSTLETNRERVKELFTDLKTKEEKDLLVAYWKAKTIPVKHDTWTEENGKDAREATEAWLAQEALTDPADVHTLQACKNTINPLHFQQLRDRLCGTGELAENPARVNYLLGILEEAEALMIYQLAEQLDKGFAHARQSFKVTSPLDLLATKRTATQGTWMEYCAFLRERTATMAPDEAFQVKYGEAYTDWLKEN